MGLGDSWHLLSVFSFVQLVDERRRLIWTLEQKKYATQKKLALTPTANSRIDPNGQIVDE
jgi:hypothetical protein